MKKYLAIFFTLLVSTASFNRCCEAEDCRVEISNADASHDDDGCAGESCSFFSCNSCTGFIFRYHNPQLEVYSATSVKHFVPMKEDPTGMYSNSSWKPPRL